MASTNGDNSEQADALQHLRDLLGAPSEQDLRQIRDTIEDRNIDQEALSQVLPAAVRQSAQQGDELAASLGPIIGDAFRNSIRDNPQELADAVAPIMGPAIRQSIKQQIRAMAQSLTKTLDQSVSPSGIRWRIEAWRTGRSFGEVVLLHTLLYRIEKLLLIDNETGLLMQGVSSVDDEDDDLVSSLLTAIQDFVRDSFDHETKAGSALQNMDTGELTIWVEHGPRAILAAAIRGEPPLELREELAATLDRIHVDYNDQLSDFQGDTEQMLAVRPDMEALLLSEFRESDAADENASAPAETPEWQKHLPWALAALCLIGLLTWGLFARRARERRMYAQILDVPPSATLTVTPNGLKVTGEASSEWLKRARNRVDRLSDIDHVDLDEVELSDRGWTTLLTAIRNEPGLVLTGAERIGAQYVIYGLRDPDAIAPEQLVQRTGFDDHTLEQHWEPYLCLDDRLAIVRQLRELNIQLPATLQVTLENGRLVVEGTAPGEWIEQFRSVVRELKTQHPIKYNLTPQKTS